MKCKYKKFLKAAYIDYSEDYCGCGSGMFIRPTITTPVIVITDNTAIIACATSGATIYYTLDGSTPTSSSTVYSGAITLTLSCTIKAIAVKPGLTDSAVASESYIHYLTQWKIVGNSEVHTAPFLTSWKVSGNSQVHTLPYPDGVVLPNGYKRCKYLTFDGSSYIDTGIIPEQGIGVSIKFKFLEQIGDDGIFGCRVSAWSADSFYCFRQKISGMLFVSYGGKICDIGSTDNFVINANDEIELHLDSSFLSFTNGTNTLTTSISSQITKETKTLYIGAINGYGSKSRIILRTFVLTNGLGNTIFNGIPCLDDNNTPCLYDTVSGTSFYNDGTGTFGYELYPQPTEIWSCGDLGQDGKYHVKISNGVDVYDIALNEPLRKVNDVADTIEFPSNTEGKALVTRNIGKYDIGLVDWQKATSPVLRFQYTTDSIKRGTSNIMCTKYTVLPGQITLADSVDKSAWVYDNILRVRDDDYLNSTVADFQQDNLGVLMLFELATPTTELIDVSPIAVSPTDTYTSANDTPYSAFEHTENKEIWSCGEYNATDGKYHILVQPQGGSIADIALTEPLRKVNDVADTIEFANGVATLTRNIGNKKFSTLAFVNQIAPSGKLRFQATVSNKLEGLNIGLLCAKYTTAGWNDVAANLSADDMIIGTTAKVIAVHDEAYTDAETFKTDNANVEVFYPLATPTTELVNAPQIAEADSYTCEISQGGKAISWSDFITEEELLYAYGVQWNKNDSNPDVTRVGNMSLHASLPVQSAMKGCLLNDNGDVVKYLNASSWTSETRDGSQGQVMIEIPTFYWKFSEDENGIQSVMLSMVEIEGYKKVNKMYVSAYQAALDRTNLKLASVVNTTAQYRGGNNTSSWDEDSQKTLLGKPVTNVSLTKFRTYARNRKANSTEWNCNTYLIQKVLYWLFVVEFATRNTQKAIDSTLTTEGYHKGGLGSGVTNVNDTTWNSYNSRNPFVACGYTDSLGNGTGQVSLTMPLGTEGANITVQVPRYRGIENPFGHVWEWTDGIHVKVQSETDGGESQVYVSYDPATWNDNNYTGYTYIGNESRSNNWIKEILFGADGDIMCKTNCTGNTYYCDHHYTNIPTTTALRGIRFGGTSNTGSHAGLVCSGSNYGPASATASFGSRLTFIPSTD